MLKRISIDDNIEFKTEVEVLNQCFNMKYDGYQRGACYVNAEKTAVAWFPQIAVEENGKLVPLSPSEKEMVNTISDDGLHMEMYSLADIKFGHGNEIHFTFAKYKGKGFKYVGTFLRDSVNSSEDKVKFIRVCDYINLEEWSYEKYIDVTEESVKDLFGQYGNWFITNENTAVHNADEAIIFNGYIEIDEQVGWFFDVDRLRWVDFIPYTLEYGGQKYYANTKHLDGADQISIIEIEDALIDQLSEENVFATESVLLILTREKNSNGFLISIQSSGEQKDGPEERDPYTTEVYSYKEGRKVAYYTSRYERKSVNRKKAIELHGLKCTVCGFDFEEKYGDIGKGFIEVHHIKPLSEIDEEIVVNPETDLVCVCSNCHRMIHKKRNGVYTIEEMRDMIKNYE